MFQFFAAFFNGNVRSSKNQNTFKTYLPALSSARFQTEKSKTEREPEKQQPLSMR